MCGAKDLCLLDKRLQLYNQFAAVLSKYPVAFIHVSYGENRNKIWSKKKLHRHKGQKVMGNKVKLKGTMIKSTDNIM